MQPNNTHHSIAQQIDHMKPALLKPGTDIGLAILDERTVVMHCPPLNTTAIVEYLPGPDLYGVTVNRDGDAVSEFDQVYCDQLGDLLFGCDLALPWRQPFVTIVTFDADGNPTEHTI